jgi:tetratricopeptide (TPR) repeat protein
MSDPLRTDPGHALDGASEPGRDAKIEQLLLSGLDHYFAAEYEQAINVWTRALFLDRNHPRARAYIERARSALSERLRQSEELLHGGVEAFNRGDAGEARRLLEAAMVQGAPSDQTLALLDRLNRLEQGAGPHVQGPAARSGSGTGLRVGRRRPARRTRVIAWSATVLIIVAAAAIFAIPNIDKWRAVLMQAEPQTAAAPSAAERPLPVPRRAETAIARARALAAGGRLHDALLALDLVRITDPLRPEADRLRADIQQQLLALDGSRP